MPPNARARQEYILHEQDSHVHPTQYVERLKAPDDPKPKEANQEEEGERAEETTQQSHALGR
jgi:hypothetical protein